MSWIYAGSLLKLDWASLVLSEWYSRPTWQDDHPLLLDLPCSWSALHPSPLIQWTHLIVGILSVTWKYPQTCSTLQILRTQQMWIVSPGLWIHILVFHAQRTSSSRCLLHGLPLGSSKLWSVGRCWNSLLPVSTYETDIGKCKSQTFSHQSTQYIMCWMQRLLLLAQFHWLTCVASLDAFLDVPFYTWPA